MAGNASTPRMELAALMLLDRAEEPVGAARLAQALREAGIPVAEATAGRFLRYLDERGYTRVQSTTRGRLITEAGRQRLGQLRLLQRQDEQGAQVVRAARATAIDELIDLLYVRRVVETEAARIAASRASDEEIARIWDFTEAHVHEAGEHRDTLEPSLSFHRMVVDASHNRMLIAVARLLLEPANDPLEKLLGHISLDAGATFDLALDHRLVAEALRARDAAAAEAAMRQHMDKLVHEVEAYRAERRGPRVRRAP
ncbi:MAG: FCD domain-containing protein, partial [Thermomicrobiaceae bacterium]|nr:FCD domain-containing protein [Thermomicrobiaceae bacterium]